MTTETDAMRRALGLAASPGVPHGPNPRVGCVLLDSDGAIVADGHHRGIGTAHAEVDALRQAGDAVRGGTAVVTLEPCNHTGRTGPCAGALVAAGVARVVFAQTDPNPVAAGGSATLRAAGVEVEGGLLADEAEALNVAWTFAVTHGRPFVTWKAAAPPAATGFGSVWAKTTRATPAATSASAHGPVRPVWLHGSRVTTAVPPRAASPAWRRASTSACAVPMPR